MYSCTLGGGTGGRRVFKYAPGLIVVNESNAMEPRMKINAQMSGCKMCRAPSTSRFASCVAGSGVGYNDALLESEAAVEAALAGLDDAIGLLR